MLQKRNMRLAEGSVAIGEDFENANHVALVEQRDGRQGTDAKSSRGLRINARVAGSIGT
jgi:hypothetical protein